MRNFNLSSSVQNVLSKIIPSNAQSSETEALAQICVMGMVPTGNENPRDILKMISDKTVGYIANNIKSFRKDPVIRRISQFFVIEWGLRNGHIEEWRWTWDDPNGGHVSYRPSIPYDKLEDLATQIMA